MSKTALVTGASRGIGAAVARRLAKDGYNVVINYRSSEDEAKALVAEISSLGVKALAYKADVSDYSQCKKLVSATIEEFGGIDVLVNNAGITKDGLLVRMSEEQFDAVINANLKSAFNMLRLAGEKMFRAKRGKIINISSVVGISGNAGQVNYAASKAGIVGMTKSAARELGARGICVNAIAPGFIETDMTAVLPEESKKALQEGITLKRLGKPSDIAGAVAFLASEDADYITGQVLVVDGGLTF